MAMNTNGNVIATDPKIGRVKALNINEEMQQAYLDYAMSVIVSRALPDVRDGLKPVQRRILFAMHDMGLTYDKPYKKSARIVGEVLGKYHPHGDAAVYDAMVRMAQEFSLRYPLIDGQGNFGSVDGDGAAAMRYTEARLQRLSDELLRDLEKDTVAFVDNFDNTLREPSVLPSAFPNLLVNGASGIAVGMATNIPPHNLGEVVDATVYLIDHWKQLDDITVEHLLHFIKGPDFPTGGIVYRFGTTPPANGAGRSDNDAGQNDVIANAYATGRGTFVVQAKAHMEEMSRSRSRIVVTELPYQTNKTRLLERIAELVRDGKIEGITDLRDESDRTGMRIVIELTRNVQPREVLANLFKLTPMQQTFGVSMLALVDGEPRTLSLKRLLFHFVEHRREVVRRRSEYDLARAQARTHILEGLLKALDHLDEVIQAIRRSRTAETARTNLMRNFGFTELQAQAILDMPLRRLAALERKKLEDEYADKLKLIKHLEALLASPEKILGVIKDELLEIKQQYGDARRTQIVDRSKGALTTRDLLPDQHVWVSVSASGQIARQPAESTSKTSLRNASKGAEIALLAANTRDQFYLFTADGRSSGVLLHQVPEGNGAHWADLSNLGRRDKVTTALTLPRQRQEDPQGYLIFATRLGRIKRVQLSDFLAAAYSNPVVMNVDKDDELRWVAYSEGVSDILLVTADGQSIRFKEEEVRSMGLAAAGVGAIKLKAKDEAVDCEVVSGDGELLTVTAAGFAKRTPLSEYPTQSRFGSGVIAHKLSARTGKVVGAAVLSQGSQAPAVVITKRGVVKTMSRTDVTSAGRAAQGRATISVARGDEVVAVSILMETPPPGPAPEVPPNLPKSRRSRARSSGNGAGSRRASSSAATTKRASATQATSKGSRTASSRNKAETSSKKAEAGTKKAGTSSSGTTKVGARSRASSTSKEAKGSRQTASARTKKSGSASAAQKSTASGARRGPKAEPKTKQANSSSEAGRSKKRTSTDKTKNSNTKTKEIAVRRIERPQTSQTGKTTTGRKTQQPQPPQQSAKPASSGRKKNSRNIPRSVG